MTRSEALEQPNAEVLLNGRCVGRTEYDGRYGTVLVMTWHDPAGCGHRQPAYEVGQAVEVRWTTNTGDEWRPTIIRKTYGPNAHVIEIEAHTPAGQPYMYRVSTDDVRPAST